MTGIVAIDANLFLRHTVRRFLCAMQEIRGGRMLVLAEVPRESVRKYPRIVEAVHFAVGVGYSPRSA